MSLQDERDLPDDALTHDPARGAGKRDGLAINGDAGHPSTQVTANKNYTDVGYQNEPTFLFHPPISRTWHEGMPSFLMGEGR